MLLLPALLLLSVCMGITLRRARAPRACTLASCASRLLRTLAGYRPTTMQILELRLEQNNTDNDVELVEPPKRMCFEFKTRFRVFNSQF